MSKKGKISVSDIFFCIFWLMIGTLGFLSFYLTFCFLQANSDVSQISSSSLTNLPPNSDTMENSSSTTASVSFESSSMVDKEGEDIKKAPNYFVTSIEPTWTEVKRFNQGYAPVHLFSGNWIYIDKNGNTMFEKKEFKDAYTFADNGIARVQDLDGQYGALNLKGEYIIEPQYGGMTAFVDNYAGVKPLDSEKWHFINLNNEKCFGDKEYENVKEFSDGFAAVKDHGKWDFIDTNGHLLGFEGTTYPWSDVDSFSNGYAAVKKDGLWGFIDTNGILIIDFCGIKANNNITFQIADGYASLNFFIEGIGFIDLDGQKTYDANWADLHNCYSGVFPVKYSDGRWGLINTEKKEVTEKRWQSLSAFFEGYASAQLETGTCEIIDLQGNTVVIKDVDEIDELGWLSDGMYAYKKGSKWGFLKIGIE